MPPSADDVIEPRPPHVAIYNISYNIYNISYNISTATIATASQCSFFFHGLCVHFHHGDATLDTCLSACHATFQCECNACLLLYSSQLLQHEGERAPTLDDPSSQSPAAQSSHHPHRVSRSPRPLSLPRFRRPFIAQATLPWLAPFARAAVMAATAAYVSVLLLLLPVVGLASWEWRLPLLLVPWLRLGNWRVLAFVSPSPPVPPPSPAVSAIPCSGSISGPPPYIYIYI